MVQLRNIRRVREKESMETHGEDGDPMSTEIQQIVENDKGNKSNMQENYEELAQQKQEHTVRNENFKNTVKKWRTRNCTQLCL